MVYHNYRFTIENHIRELCTWVLLGKRANDIYTKVTLPTHLVIGV